MLTLSLHAVARCFRSRLGDRGVTAPLGDLEHVTGLQTVPKQNRRPITKSVFVFA